MGSDLTKTAANLGEPREVDGQQGGGGFLALMRREHDSPVLLKGDGGLTLVDHLQLRSNRVKHNLQASKQASESVIQSSGRAA